MTKEGAMLALISGAVVISDAVAAIIVFSVGIAIGVLIIIGADTYTRHRR